jgi:hypothetical protein
MPHLCSFGRNGVNEKEEEIVRIIGMREVRILG